MSQDVVDYIMATYPKVWIIAGLGENKIINYIGRDSGKKSIKQNKIDNNAMIHVLLKDHFKMKEI